MMYDDLLFKIFWDRTEIYTANNKVLGEGPTIDIFLNNCVGL